MDFGLTEEQGMLKESTRDFMNSDRVKRWIKGAQETKEYPYDFMRAAAEQGYLGMCIDPKYGGSGLSCLDAVIAFEEIAYASAALSLCVLVQNSLAAFAIETFGNDAQKERYLHLMTAGELFGCFANTEPDVGSDAKNIRTRAERRGDKWILNGTKRFITSASVSGVAVVFARTAKREAGSPGITAFVIDVGGNVSGYHLDKIEPKIGQHGSTLCEFTLTDYEASDENVLGEAGNGWEVCDGTFLHSRVWIAAQGVGIAQRAFDEAARYTLFDRQTFGQPIFKHSAHEFADLKTEIESARLLTYKASWLEDSDSPDLTEVSSMAKLSAAETAEKSARLFFRKCGGLSYAAESLSSRLLMDALALPIYEGPSEIQRLIIAKKIAESFSR